MSLPIEDHVRSIGRLMRPEIEARIAWLTGHEVAVSTRLTYIHRSSVPDIVASASVVGKAGARESVTLMPVMLDPFGRLLLDDGFDIGVADLARRVAGERISSGPALERALARLAAS